MRIKNILSIYETFALLAKCYTLECNHSATFIVKTGDPWEKPRFIFLCLGCTLDTLKKIYPDSDTHTILRKTRVSVDTTSFLNMLDNRKI